MLPASHSSLSDHSYPLKIDWQNHRKGALGRAVVVGGCTRYTGAPYFAASSALRSCAELIHVATESGSRLNILLPDCIVETFDNCGSDACWPFNKKSANTYIVGCGLGQSTFSYEMLTRLMKSEFQSGITMVLDGDALQHELTAELVAWAQRQTDMNIIFTANQRELANLRAVSDLRLTPCVHIVGKGYVDVIYSHGRTTEVQHTETACRRPGGLGDILAGTIGGITSMQKIPDAHLAIAISLKIVRNAINDYHTENREMTLSYSASDVLPYIGRNVFRLIVCR